MENQHRQRTLVELPEYSAQIDAIVAKHTAQVVTPLLAGVMWGISTNPQAFDRGTWNIRIAKTRSLGLTIPTFLILFQIENEGKEYEYILLCWIEEAGTLDELTEYLM